MKSRKILLKKSLLYLIIDKPGYAKLSSCGVGIIQLRDKFSAKSQVLKSAVKLSKLLNGTKTLFIVNDYIDLALLSGADGVHLGQGDLPLKQARILLGKDKIIGISCHSLKQALKAQKDGADYIGIGPVYSTATKPEYRPIGLRVLRQLKGRIRIPYFAIGDVNEANLGQIIACGAKRIAVARAILKADNPACVASRLFKKVKESYLKIK
ncbi:MAG: thiamine phosphate synthase [Candidatus Omnitrophica bacterium]|jgi:thiamine-phosphate pyrophosphorylase|nr:thiamine phosphate synthase [Candidatus Omnitrophota bacterium]